MTEDDKTNKLIEHLLKIVEAITMELKDHKHLLSSNDKTLALVDQRLKIAESILERVEKMQRHERVESASRVGSEKIKWAILSFVGGGALMILLRTISSHVS